MAVFFDHTIVPSTDRERSATFFAEMLGLPEPSLEEPFLVVHLANDAALAFGGWDETVEHAEHYAFLMSEDEFDAFYARLVRSVTSRTGRTRTARSRSRSTARTVAAARTSTTPTATSSRSSRSATAPAH